MEEDSIIDKPNIVSRFFTALSQRYQLFLDRWTPYIAVRWITTVVFSVVFMARILYLQGYYIVTYALGIYHLNLFIAFLTPKIDPAFDFESESEEGPSLPTTSNDEFRPFMRRLPEFKFWHSATKAIIVAFCATFFEAFDVPVFWPILVMYFIVLFCLTMKRQIKHMIKYRYIPFTYGKPIHAGRRAFQNVNSLPKAPTSEDTAVNQPLINMHTDDKHVNGADVKESQLFVHSVK